LENWDCKQDWFLINVIKNDNDRSSFVNWLTGKCKLNDRQQYFFFVSRNQGKRIDTTTITTRTHPPNTHLYSHRKKSFSWFTFQNHHWKGNDLKSSPITFKSKIIMTSFWVIVLNYLSHFRIIMKLIFLFNSVFFTLLIIEQFLHH
jgi:hypothetical protein